MNNMKPQSMSNVLQSCILAVSLLGALTMAHANQFYNVKNNQKSQFPIANAKITVINVWATWCVPCRTEMPALSSWYQAQTKKRPDIKMVGVALDKQDNIQKFLKTTKVSYPLWRFEGDSTAWMKSIGNKIGGVPYTVVQAKGCATTVPIYGLVDGQKLDAAVSKITTACKI